MTHQQPNEMDIKPWERQVIEKMLLESLKEQRRSRRWRIFFRSIILLVIIAIIFLLATSTSSVIKPHTALIRIEGEIADEGKASAENIIKGLNSAFDSTETRGIILSINSPGGTPVQANIVYEEIMRLRKLRPQIKVYAVCSDLCASGAYYIAAAADKIYADKASLVGSIGVITDGFGFVDTLQKLGVQRRVYTSGAEKGFLDPFSPVKEQDVKHLQTMLDIIHQQFITAVKEGRGSRLKNNPELFSGLVWTGQQALELGLIDGYGSVNQIAKSIIKEENVIDYTAYGDLIKRFSDTFSTSFTHSVASLLGLKLHM